MLRAMGCAWTVWVPEGDVRDRARLLEAAGHHLDAEPRAMGMDLAEAQEPDAGGIDWDASRTVEEDGAINDRAYGYPDGHLERGSTGSRAA